MPKRSRKAPADYNANAFRIVGEATGQATEAKPAAPKAKKNPHAVALGRKGGKIGGKARADALTPAERSEIARKAAAARWGLKDET